jgi:hypothetical protein
MPVALIPVTAENVGSVCDLAVHERQHLVRFMVDAASQGRAIGRRAVALLVDELRAAGHTELELSYVPGEGGQSAPGGAAASSRRAACTAESSWCAWICNPSRSVRGRP